MSLTFLFFNAAPHCTVVKIDHERKRIERGSKSMHNLKHLGSDQE